MRGSRHYQISRIFGGISNVRLKVTNDSDYPLDLVKIKVSYFKADSGLYKEEYVNFNRVGTFGGDPPGTRTVTGEQASRSDLSR